MDLKAEQAKMRRKNELPCNICGSKRHGRTEHIKRIYQGLNELEQHLETNPASDVSK